MTQRGLAEGRKEGLLFEKRNKNFNLFSIDVALERAKPNG
jgi:hypothetical protein